jgi:hypothetical protein
MQSNRKNVNLLDSDALRFRDVIERLKGTHRRSR